MGLVSKGLFKNLWRPDQCCFRYKGRFNVEKPRPPHFERAKLLKICEPRFPRKVDPETPLTKLCKGPGLLIQKAPDPSEKIWVEEVLNQFRTYQYNFFYHLNSMPYSEFEELRIKLHRLGVKTMKYKREILEKALKGTKYEPILVLFSSHNLLGFSNEVNLKSMIEALKNTNVILMAGIIKNRILNLEELKYYSELPDLQTLRSSLVSVLNSSGGQIVQQLNHHPSILVQHLDMHAQSSEEKKS